jgi:hypothetical protein
MLFKTLEILEVFRYFFVGIVVLLFCIYAVKLMIYHIKMYFINKDVRKNKKFMGKYK